MLLQCWLSLYGSKTKNTSRSSPGGRPDQRPLKSDQPPVPGTRYQVPGPLNSDLSTDTMWIIEHRDTQEVHSALLLLGLCAKAAQSETITPLIIITQV